MDGNCRWSIDEARSNPTSACGWDKGKFDDSVNVLQATSYNHGTHESASLLPIYLTTEAMEAPVKVAPIPFSSILFIMRREKKSTKNMAQIKINFPEMNHGQSTTKLLRRQATRKHIAILPKCYSACLLRCLRSTMCATPAEA